MATEAKDAKEFVVRVKDPQMIQDQVTRLEELLADMHDVNPNRFPIKIFTRDKWIQEIEIVYRFLQQFLPKK